MSNQINVKERKVLRNEMAEVFSHKIKALSSEMQYILLDDLVTAFENRLSALSRVKSSQPTVEFELTVGNEQVLA